MQTWSLDFLDNDDREAILQRATLREVQGGTVIIARDSDNDSLHLILEGFVRVQRDVGGSWMAVARMGPGEFFGEMSLLEAEPASATIVADGRVRLASIERGHLVKLADSREGFRERLFRSLAVVLSQRLRALGGFVASLDRTAEQRHHALFERLQPPDPGTHEALRGRVEDLKGQLAEAEFMCALGESPGVVYGAVFAEMERVITEFGGSGARVLHNDLYATWMRSPTIAGSLLAVGGSPCANPTMRRVLFHRPAGDGQVGELLDAWLLDRPSLEGLRWAVDRLTEEVRGGSMMLVGAVQGAVTRAALRCASSLVVLDDDEQALAAVHEHVAGRPAVFGKVDFLDLVRGRGRLAMEPVDVVLGIGILDQVPDEDFQGVLAICRRWMRPGGVTWLSGTPPGVSDEALFRHLLHWPCHRRTQAQLSEAAAAAGLEARFETHPAHLLLALSVRT